MQRVRVFVVQAVKLVVRGRRREEVGILIGVVENPLCLKGLPELSSEPIVSSPGNRVIDRPDLLEGRLSIVPLPSQSAEALMSWKVLIAEPWHSWQVSILGLQVWPPSKSLGLASAHMASGAVRCLVTR